MLYVVGERFMGYATEGVTAATMKETRKNGFLNLDDENWRQRLNAVSSIRNW